MEKQRKSAGTIALVVLLLIVTIVSLILATYAWARYTTFGDGNATAQVAKWDVTFAKGSTVFTKTYNYVAPERLAPGTEGQYTMNLNSSLTEVAYAYKIEISNIQNRPTNLKFYAVNGNTESEIILNDNAGTAAEGTVLLDGNNVATTDKNVTIKWVWPYRTGETDEQKTANDIIDTAEGTNPQQMSFDVTLTAWQLNPADGTVTPNPDATNTTIGTGNTVSAGTGSTRVISNNP